MGEKGTSKNARPARFVAAAFLAACLYALSTPCSKVLLANVAPNMMAALLYLGAGGGMAALTGARAVMRRGASDEKPLERSDAPYVVAMVLLDVAAPILLMAGLAHAAPENVALLNNFEIVATSLIALAFFGEHISRRLWAAIGLITLSSLILSFEDTSSLAFSGGSLLVLLACACWGLENNCTRMMSQSDPLQIVVLKGFGSGLGSLAIACALGEKIPDFPYALAALALGFLSYGLSIFCYVYAQRQLGAAKTSAYYAIAPFIGAGLSLVLFRAWPEPSFWVALAIMGAGAYLAAR